MKRTSKVSFDLDNWFARLLYEAQMDYFHDKAARNISDDKRKNLKRKFRVERNVYPYHHTDLERDWLMERQTDVECGDPVYVNTGIHKYANLPIKFKPKPLPG